MFKLGDKVALKEDVTNGTINFFRVKKILESNMYTIGRCSCRPDLYKEVHEDDLYSYDTVRDIIKNR